MDTSTLHPLQTELFRAISALNTIAELPGAPARERRLAATAALDACATELARLGTAAQSPAATIPSLREGAGGRVRETQVAQSAAMPSVVPSATTSISRPAERAVAAAGPAQSQPASASPAHHSPLTTHHSHSPAQPRAA